MSNHYAIIMNLSNSPRESATVELASEVASSCRFVIFPANGTPVIQTADVINGLARSTNLLTTSGSELGLVRAECGESSGAILRQVASNTKVAIDMPKEDRAAGVVFHVPVGEVGPQSAILVANVGEGFTDVRLLDEVQRIDPMQVKTFRLTSTHANRGLALKSLSDVKLVAQLVVDDRRFDATMLTPV